MAVNIKKIGNKIENRGSNLRGRITADDWNTLWHAVSELQDVYGDLVGTSSAIDIAQWVAENSDAAPVSGSMKLLLSGAVAEALENIYSTIATHEHDDYSIADIGTEIPIAVELSCGDCNMDDMRFYVEFSTVGKSYVAMTKKQMQRISPSKYLAIVDTTTLSPGVLRMKAHANVPDKRTPSGMRKEVVTVQTNIILQ